MSGPSEHGISGACGRAAIRQAPAAGLQQVAPGVSAYLQPDGGWMVNNTGAVVGDRAVVLVDTTSTERRNRALLAAVAGVSGDKPVRTVVNTHHHADHTLARAYSELEGQPWGTALPLAPVAAAMAEFAGGPLRCLA